jgi:chromate transporter
MGELAALASVFAQLSLVAIGGVNAVVPDLHRQVVDVHHWMSDADFVALFALAQASPGPNMLISTLIGWRVAGLAGALTATAALIGPPAVLAYTLSNAWHRFRERPLRAQIQAGVTPVTVGLVMAAAVLLCMTAATSIGAGLVTLATAFGLLVSRFNPLWFLAAGAALGAAGVLG